MLPQMTEFVKSNLKIFSFSLKIARISFKKMKDSVIF